MPRRRHDRLRSPAKRGTPTRAPYDRFLVVCEGSKTEPSYIHALCENLRINRANYTIVGDCANDPKGIAEAAIKKFEVDKDYDAVFCVFDRDEHTGFQACVERIRTKRLRRSKGEAPAKFEAITSVPAFEFWLLLHFCDSDAPIDASGGRTAAQNLIRKLKQYLPDYEKDGRAAFGATFAEIETAKTRSQAICRRSAGAETANPSTRMHLLATYIQSIGS